MCISPSEQLVRAYCPLVEIFVCLIDFIFFFSIFRRDGNLWQLPSYLILQNIPGSCHFFLGPDWNPTFLQRTQVALLGSSISKPQSLIVGWYFKTIVSATEGLIGVISFSAFKSLIHLEFILVYIVIYSKILYSSV